MKLAIRRNQADVKGFFGGHKGVMFSLSGRCMVTDEERALVARYKTEDYVLAHYQKQVKGCEPLDITITISGIIAGKIVETDDIGTLLELEQSMKTGCANFKTLLEVMATFGGEQVFDI